MRISKRMQSCVSFARFAREHRLEPADLAELLGLAAAAFKAGERECNTGRSADPARRRFEAKAKAMRFGAYWPGLLPALKRRGETIHLPDVG